METGWGLWDYLIDPPSVLVRTKFKGSTVTLVTRSSHCSLVSGILFLTLSVIPLSFTVRVQVFYSLPLFQVWISVLRFDPVFTSCPIFFSFSLFSVFSGLTGDVPGMGPPGCRVRVLVFPTPSHRITDSVLGVPRHWRTSSDKVWEEGRSRFST